MAVTITIEVGAKFTATISDAQWDSLSMAERTAAVEKLIASQNFKQKIAQAGVVPYLVRLSSDATK